MKNGIVCKFQYDPGTQRLDRAEYSPDIHKLNLQIRLWKKSNVLFAGIVHSHPQNQTELSADDKDYVRNILHAMPQCVKFLYFPIVFPNISLRSFKAVRRDNRIDIFEDKIKIVKGV